MAIMGVLLFFFYKNVKSNINKSNEIKDIIQI